KGIGSRLPKELRQEQEDFAARLNHRP
ncbi:MAG: hypothetical protein H6Q07_1474, partial [Acidobacteria bacterium]|nr:hypothetical protein [Acidobacteriota bacterium]